MEGNESKISRLDAGSIDAGHQAVPADQESQSTQEKKWLVLCFFGMAIGDVETVLIEKGVEYFYPKSPIMARREGHDNEKPQPLWSKMVFVKETVEGMTAEMFLKIFQGTPLEKHFFLKRTHPVTGVYMKISDREMVEFRRFCNPDANLNYFITPLSELRTKKDALVIITHGPLKGTTGRLVRKSKRYFLVKKVLGQGLMVQVARWTCMAIDEEKSQHLDEYMNLFPYDWEAKKE